MRNSFLKALGVVVWIVSFGVSAQTQVDLNAKVATLSGPFILTNGYISGPMQTSPAVAGRAVFSFTVSNQGPYAVVARVETTGTNSHSLRIGIDVEPDDESMTWDIPATPQFSDRIVTWRADGSPAAGPKSRKAFTLAPGSHQLIIQGLYTDTRLARVSILPLPAAPTNVRVVADVAGKPQPPAPPANLHVLSAGP